MDDDRVIVDTPRDRHGQFDPMLIPKCARRFPDLDEKIIALYARGMSTRDIPGHIQDLYDIDASANLVSPVTDQCDITTGTIMLDSNVCVTPPKTFSFKLLVP